MRTALATCLLVLLVVPRPSTVVIRHDRGEAAALKLGERFEAAGRVLPDGGCTLISPTWAVTAAHVAASLGPGSQVRFGDRTIVVARVIIHPEGKGPAGRPPEVDLALLELAEPVTHVAPVALFPGRDELGRTIFIIGYGDYGTPHEGLRRSDGRRRAVTNVVHDAGPLRLFVRFDAPPSGTDLEGVGAPGDSGGPALLEDAGRLYLAGVSSGSMDGKPGQYGVTDVYTRVSTYIDWIRGHVSAR